MNDKKFWNERYASGGNSGYGSSGTQAELKLDKIKENIKQVEAITDIGCGDFAFGKRLLEIFSHVDYHGFDISDFIVKENKKAYPEYSFHTLESMEFYWPGDLLLCIDVLFHVSS